MARRYRPRKLFKFWLYHDLAEDTHLMEYIEYLHKTRQFVTVLRQGLRLMWALGEGDLSVLFELFPTLRAQFSPDNSALIEEFRQMLQAQNTAAPAAVPSLPAGPKPLTVSKTITMPVFEDDDQDTVIIRHDANASMGATANFLKAAFGMVGEETVLQNDNSSQPQQVILSDDDEDDRPPPLAASEFALRPLG